MAKDKDAEKRSTVKHEGNEIILQVEELLINAQLSRGAYNAEKFYAHCKVTPKEGMMIRIPVSELGTLKTIKEAIEALSKEVIGALDIQLKVREGGKPGVTAIGEIPSGSKLGGTLDSGYGDEPKDQF